MIPVSRPFLGAPELDAVRRVFETGWLGMGPVTIEFERAVARWLRTEEVVAVSSGTAALHLALSASGIRTGDEVLVPSFTFAATVQAILAVGATPVFCDIVESSQLMDIDDAITRLSNRTRAVIPVHYGGRPVDMRRLLYEAEIRGIIVIEDAAHAFGSSLSGLPIGSFGHLTCFSFDPIKVLTSGEGGAIAVHNADTAKEIRRQRVLGTAESTWNYRQSSDRMAPPIVTTGFRYHMPDFCAAIGLTQLEQVDERISSRRRICSMYDGAFRDHSTIQICNADYAQIAPFLYTVRVPSNRRADFRSSLLRAGVETGIHYPPNHLQPYFRDLVTAPLPVTERVGSQIVSLPLFPQMTDSDVSTVIEAALAFH